MRLHHSEIFSAIIFMSQGVRVPDFIRRDKKYPAELFFQSPKPSRYCALIGWDHSVALPALLCHKDTAQGTQRISLCLYGRRATIIDSFHAWTSSRTWSGPVSLNITCPPVSQWAGSNNSFSPFQVHLSLWPDTQASSQQPVRGSSLLSGKKKNLVRSQNNNTSTILSGHFELELS